MFFNVSTGLKRTLWSAAAASLAVVCASPSWANGIIAPARRFDGGRLSVQTQTGSNCSSTAPDRAAVSVVAGYRDRDYTYTGGYYGNTGSGDFVGGVALTIPFGGPDFEDCNGLLTIEEARNRIDLAVTLFETGAMSADEFEQVMRDARAVLGVSADRPAGAPPVRPATKPADDLSSRKR